MSSCVVKWCKKRKERLKNETGITFHIFPKNEARRIEWTMAVRWERQEYGWIPSNTSKVCSIHFSDEDMYLSSKGNIMLKKCAVPICTMVRKIYCDSKAFLCKIPSLSQDSLEIDIKLEPLSPETDIVSDNSCQVHVKIEPLSPETKIPSDSSPQVHVTNIKPQSPETNIPFYSRPQKNVTTVNCPKCTYTFGVQTVEVTNEYFPAQQKEKLFQNIYTNTKSFNLSPKQKSNFPSSDTTEKLIQKLKQKSFLAEKRLAKLKNFQKKSRRLKTKNIGLKKGISALKKVLSTLQKEGFVQSVYD